VSGAEWLFRGRLGGRRARIYDTRWTVRMRFYANLVCDTPGHLLTVVL
jgi:hypothetical protein